MLFVHRMKRVRIPTAALALLCACGPAAEDAIEGEYGYDSDEGVVEQRLSVATPVPGYRITTPFGVRGSHWAAGYHTGDDYAAPTGTRVVATRGGRVVFAGYGGWGRAYGNHVIVETGGIRHMYAHLSSRSVGTGQEVALGQRIGRVGATGNVTGPHLHYEERVSPYGYYNHRRPRFNHSLPTSSGTTGLGYKNWRYGRRHSDIVGLQRALISAGCSIPAAYTDYYGTQTRSAVRCFQRRQGWSGSGADGYVGPLTAQRLWLEGPVYVSRLQHGVTNSDSVRMLQQRLNEVRRAGLPITGNYLSQTRAAVQAWQRSIGDSGSAADGNMGPRQTARLFPTRRYSIH